VVEVKKRKNPCREGSCIPEWLPDGYGVEWGPSEQVCKRCGFYMWPGSNIPMTPEEEQLWVNFRGRRGPDPRITGEHTIGSQIQNLVTSGGMVLSGAAMACGHCKAVSVIYMPRGEYTELKNLATVYFCPYCGGAGTPKLEGRALGGGVRPFADLRVFAED
jgi:hypothetical protein